MVFDWVGATVTLHLARLVHEKLAVIATFAYAQAPLKAAIENHLSGQWRFLHKITSELPRAQANQAVMDFALYFRALDDEANLSFIWKQRGMPEVGTLLLKQGGTEPLSPREMCNRIIHAKKIDWVFSKQPRIVCTGRDEERWLRAIIEVRKMLWIGAQLGS
jgi:hypothetical protein